MYITDLFPPNDKGGAEIIAFNEARTMLYTGNFVTVVTTAVKKSLKVKVRKYQGIKVYEIPTLSLLLPRYPRCLFGAISILLSMFDPLAYFYLKKVLYIEKPSLVHVHNIPLISFGALRAIRKSIKLVQTYHSYFYECPKGGLLRKWTSGGKLKICKKKPLFCLFWIFIYKRIIPKADAILAISKYILKQLQDNKWNNIYYCPNGIEYNFKKKKEFNKKYIQSNKKIILFVGRLTKAKGVDILIKAYARLGSLGKNAQLVIIGDGEEAKNLKKLAKKLCCSVLFYGRISHEKIGELYKDSYVIVIPSLWYEVLNTVAIEASLSGKPVIASNIPGVSDIVIHGSTGLLFEIGNVNDLQKKLSFLLSNEDIAKGYGKMALNHAKQFTIDEHMHLLSNIYNNLLQ